MQVFMTRCIAKETGLSIPFGSSDIKALLSYYQGEIARIQASAKGSFVGQPCKNSGAECKALNAGTFHLALVQEIGRSGYGVVVDLSRGEQIWNYPVFGFEMKKIQERPAQIPTATNVKEILLETTIYYTAEIAPQWALFGDAGQSVRSATFRYALEFNSRNEVTGGTWLDDQFLPSPEGDHPDFLWTKGRPIFLDNWKPLEQIYESATAGRSL